MKLHPNILARITALYMTSAFASVSAAQQPDLGEARLHQLLRALRPACEGLVVQISAKPEISRSLTTRPIATAAVCNCAGSKFAADSRLKRFWPLSAEDMKDPFQSEQVKSYMTARMITSILECLTQELEESLRSVELPQ